MVQVLSLSHKPGVLAAIEELETMRAGLKEALKEELQAASAAARAEAEAEAGAQRVVWVRGRLPPVAAAAVA